MKKGLKIISLILSVFFLAGCIDYNIGTTINNDKSVDINATINIDLFKTTQMFLKTGDTWNEIQKEECETSCAETDSNCKEACLNLISTTPTDSEIKSYLDEYFLSAEFKEEDLLDEEDIVNLKELGYSVEASLDQETYLYNITISNHFNNIDDISSTSTSKINLTDLFTGENKENIFFTKQEDGTYKADYIIDTTSTEDEMSSLDFDLDLDLSDIITFKYTVNLPGSALSNNATTTSNNNKTLIWELPMNSTSKNIEYTFNFNTPKINTNFLASISPENLRYISLGLIGGGSLTLLIAIIYLIKNRNK